jgi:hypothetical protein
VIPGRQAFLAFVASLAWRHGLPEPKPKLLLRCRAEALRLDDSSGSPAHEAGALFFALARDERRTGPIGRLVLPIAVTLQHLFEHRLMVRDLAGLRNLQDEIAGGLGWDATRAWFLEHVVPRPPSRLFGTS